MQGKRKRLYSILLMICLFASCICFDEFKTDGRMPFSGTANASSYILTESSISNADVCTVEMLGNTYTGLLNQPASTQNSETQRKSETLSCLIGDFASLQVSFNTYASATLCLYTEGTDAAGVIYFIHNKDGKKKI